MSFLAKYAARRAVQTALFFFVSLLLIIAAWQIPFTYTINVGLGFNDSWELTKGWGDQERNEHFSYRWTIDSQAEVRLPDVGWPSQVKVVGVAPYPDNTPPKVTLDAGGPLKTFAAEPANSVAPPDAAGRLSFKAAGPRLDAGHFTVNVEINDLPVRTFSNILNVLSSLAVLTYLVIPSWRHKAEKPQEIAFAEPPVLTGKLQPDAQS